MSACKELLATYARIKSRSAQLEKYGKEHAESVKSLLVTLDRAIDAIELAEDESENKNKGVKERQAKVSDVIDKQRKKFFDAVAEAESGMHKLTACVQQTHGAIEDAQKEARRVDVKVR